MGARKGTEMSHGQARRAASAFAAFLLVQAAPAARAADDIHALTAAYNASAHDLFRTFAASPGNIVFSPYSIGAAMAMVLAGARPGTPGAITTALRPRLPSPAGGPPHPARL